ncbi:MAG: LacI family DNA-binding transcriptional regulator [Chloroflexota bacterium]
MTSIKDVAREAGVSSATVSRVLSNKPHVRHEVRQRVLSAVDALGYRRNRTASSLRKQTSQMIGLLVSDIRNPFFTAVARAIEDAAQDNGMGVFLCNTDEDKEKERHYLNMLLDENVAGIIVSPAQEKIEGFTAVLEQNIPLVTIDRRVEGAHIDCVLSDNIRSTQKVVNHLIEEGYQRIGAVIGLKDSTTGRERMEGYQLALLNNGLQFDPALTFYVNPREQQGYESVKALLNLPQPPDAILTGNSRLTIGALQAIKEAELSIPHDIALAGFDETNWMPHLGPGITVISQPTYEMGRTAAELLLLRIAEPKRPSREVVLKGQLITRGSTSRS